MGEPSLELMDIKCARQIITYDALSAAATSKVIELFDIPQTGYMLNFTGYVNTAFVGVTRPEVKIGSPNNDNATMTLQPLSRVGMLKIGTGHQFFCQSNSTFRGLLPFYATFSSSSGNLSSLTAGEVEFVYLYAQRK